MGIVYRTSRAERDLASIVERISKDSPAAAFEWLRKMEALFRLLADEPHLGEQFQTRRWGNTRRRTMGAYLLYYRSVTNGVQILRVTHGAREQDRLI